MELFHNGHVALYIEENAIRKIFSCTHGNRSIEAGGIILGKKVIDHEKYYITDIGIPSRFDIQTPMSFVRSKITAQKHTKRAWEKSNGQVNHIGEWHSHTFPSPYPSWQDRQDVRRAYREGEFVFNHFFTLIVASDHSLYIGVVERGLIVYSNIIRMGKECTDIVQKKQKNQDEV